MPGDVTAWSQIAASNGTADPSINWQEGQAKSTVNDSARGMMAAIASLISDLFGRNITGGTGNAFTLTAAQVISSYRAGLALLILTNRANTGAATLSVNGGVTRSWTKHGGTAWATGEIQSGSYHLVIYNATNSRFESIWYFPHAHIAADISGLDAYMATTWTLTAGLGLSGGGTGAADRAIALDFTELTEDTAPDFAADYVATYDASGATHKKVRLRAAAPIPPDIILQDSRSSGTASGSASNGSWGTRTLQTTLRDPAGILVSFASNAFTLPAGSYYVEFEAGFCLPTNATGECRARFYNATDAAAVAVGCSSSTGYGNTAHSRGSQVFTIAANKSFRIEDQCNHALINRGQAASFGTNEIYSEIRIWRLA